MSTWYRWSHCRTHLCASASVSRGDARLRRGVSGQDAEKQARFRELLIEEGIHIFGGGRWYVSGGLTEADVEKTLAFTDRAMGKL